MKIQTQPTQVSKVVTSARYGLAAVAWLFAAGVVFQVFLVGLSMFDTPAYWEDHRTNGNMIGLLTYLLPVLALAGRVGWRLISLAVAVLVLFHLQYVFANADTGLVAALHAVNALVLGGMAPQLGLAAYRLARLPAAPSAVDSKPVEPHARQPAPAANPAGQIKK